LAYVRVPPRPVQSGNFGSTGDHSEEILYAEAGQIVVGHLHFECDFSNGDKLQDDVVSPIDVVPPYLAPPQLWTQGKGRALAERAGGLVAVDPNRLPVNHRIFVNLRIGQKLGSGGFFVVRLNGAGVNLQRKIEPSQLGNKIDLSFTPRRRGSIQLSATTQVVVVGAYHETVPAAHLRSNVVRLLVR